MNALFNGSDPALVSDNGDFELRLNGAGILVVYKLPDDLEVWSAENPGNATKMYFTQVSSVSKLNFSCRIQRRGVWSSNIARLQLNLLGPFRDGQRH